MYLRIVSNGLDHGSIGRKTPYDGTLLPEQDSNTARILNGYYCLIS